MTKIYGYGVDVSSYQPNAVSASWYRNIGADYAVIKTSESTNYRNPIGANQIAGAKAAGIPVHGYHFAQFLGNSNKAVSEGNYAVQAANAMGLPKGNILVCDYEVRGGYSAINTAAIIAFLKTVKAGGYIPALYTGPSFKGLLDADAVYNATGATLWVAAYPLGDKATLQPLFNYFPGMSNHISAWQFTDNWKGQHIDASVDITGIWTKKNAVPTPAPAPAPKPTPAPSVPQVQADGWAGVATVKRLQQLMGTPQDGLISGQSSYNKPYLPNFTSIQYSTGGSQLVFRIQKALQVKADGYMGRDTIKVWQQRLGVPADGIAGGHTIAAIQRALNSNKLY